MNATPAKTMTMLAAKAGDDEVRLAAIKPERIAGTDCANA